MTPRIINKHIAMNTTQIKHFTPAFWLYTFLSIHLLLWTLIPILVRFNLPMDAIEGTIWGQQLEWGYDKNPYLNGWLTTLATTLDGQSGWMIYLFSQLSVVMCMWAIWQLAKKMLPPVYALVSVLLLECIQYFNFHAIDFNDNTLELGLWALAILFFYHALRATSKCKEILAWLLTGFFIGLGLMAKYYTLTLMAGMFLFLLFNKENRQRLLTLPPYLGLIVFIIVCLPHVVWLFSHDFITVRYVVDRGSSIPHWTNHFTFPIEFLWQQIQVLLPILLPCLLLLTGKKPLLSTPKIKVSAFNQAFLFFVAAMPLILTLAISFILGTKLRAGWGMPLLSTAGIISMLILQPRLSIAKISAFLLFIFILIIVEISGYSISLMMPTTKSSANYPGREIANRITQLWHDTYHRPLKYVGGSRWVGGNIEFYSPDHPAVLIELNEKISPWINHDDMQKQGAILIWEISQWNDLPDYALQKFKKYKNINVITFDWHRNSGNLPPIKIGVVILPPQ